MKELKELKEEEIGETLHVKTTQHGVQCSGKSPHILSVSSSLLGFCLIILTSLKVFKQTEKTIIDEIDVVAVILFMSSCLFSFLAIRDEGGRNKRFERIADYIFLAGLFLLFAITILFAVSSFA